MVRVSGVRRVMGSVAGVGWAYGLDYVVLLVVSLGIPDGGEGGATYLELDEERKDPAAQHRHGVLEPKRSVAGSVLGKRRYSDRSLSASRRCGRYRDRRDTLCRRVRLSKVEDAVVRLLAVSVKVEVALLMMS